MKVLIILLAAFALSNGAKLDRTYLPPNAQTSGGSGNFLQTPNGQSFDQGSGFSQNGNYAQNGNSRGGNGFAQNLNTYDNRLGNFHSEDRPERAQATFERNAAILRQDNQNDGETYSYGYETENGIIAEENGVATNGVEAQGGFSYTGDDGQVYSIRYTADQNGFVPQGDHLPTPPPVPEEILRALEQNERDEAAGVYDDGSYNEAKYGSADQYDGNYGRGSSYSNDDLVVTNAAEIQPGFDNQINFGKQFSRANQENNGNQAGFSNQGSSGASNAYLPPSANQRANGFGSRNREGSFNGRNGYRY